MNQKEKSRLWAERITNFRASGQTRKEWCQENQIPVATMDYWIRKQRFLESMSNSETEPVFAKLPSDQELLATNNSVSDSPVSIFISNSIRIEISSSCSPELLSILIRTLKEHA